MNVNLNFGNNDNQSLLEIKDYMAKNSVDRLRIYYPDIFQDMDVDYEMIDKSFVISFDPESLMKAISESSDGNS